MHATTILIRMFTALAALPPDSWARGTGRFCGWLLCVVFKCRRQYVEETLRRCFPQKSDREIDAVVKGIYRNFCTTVVEILRILHAPPGSIGELVKVENMEYALDAVKQGRGMLVMSGHIGNWELMGPACANIGYEMHAVVKHQRNRQIDEALDLARRRMGTKTLFAGDSYRECIRVLRRGGNIAMIIDQNMIRREAVFVEFFGRKAATTPGLAILAAQTKAPILPVYMTRNSDGKHTLHICPWLEPPPDRKLETIEQATRQYTRVLEDIIRREPEHWAWFHRRWNTRPPEEDEREEE